MGKEVLLLLPLRLRDAALEQHWGLTLIASLRSGRNLARAPRRCPEQESAGGVYLLEGEGRRFAVLLLCRSLTEAWRRIAPHRTELHVAKGRRRSPPTCCFVDATALLLLHNHLLDPLVATKEHHRSRDVQSPLEPLLPCCLGDLEPLLPNAALFVPPGCCYTATELLDWCPSILLATTELLPSSLPLAARCLLP